MIVVAAKGRKSSTMSTILKETVLNAIKNAMRQGDKDRLGVLRMVSAAIKQREVDERIVVEDPIALIILDKMIKERRDSISQFLAGQRLDLVKKEEYEITVIQEFMPTPLTAEEIASLINDAIRQSGATSLKDMGKVMAILKPQIQGKADAGLVSAKIKEHLS